MTTKKQTTKPAAATKKRKRKTAQFLQKPTCTTCRKARAYMEKRGFDLHFRNLDKERLSADELEKRRPRSQGFSEHAQRTVPTEKHERESAHARRRYSHDGR
jgi:glutaredoxin